MASSLGPNYRRLWTASAFSNVADGVFQVALPLLALDLTRSPAAVAGVALAARLPWLFFALPAGALADRLDRRRTMVRVDIARVVVLALLAVLTAAGAVTLPVLYVIAFGLGIGETLFDTSAQSVMPAIVERRDLSRANGRLFAAELTMNQFVGPPLGGVLASIAVAAAFFGSAGGYLVAAVSLMLMSGAFRPHRTAPPVRLRTDVAEGLRYLWRHKLLRTLGLMVGVMNLGATATFAVLPLYAVAPGAMGLSKAGFGLLLTSTGVGSLVGSFTAARLERSVGRGRLLAVCVLATGLPTIVLVLTSAALPVAVALAVTGLAVVVWNVVTVSLRQRIVPDELLGRVNAGYRLLAWGTMPLGAALGGALAEIASVHAVFVFNAVTTTLLVLFSRTIVTDRAIEAAEAATVDHLVPV